MKPHMHVQFTDKFICCKDFAREVNRHIEIIVGVVEHGPGERWFHTVDDWALLMKVNLQFIKQQFVEKSPIGADITTPAACDALKGMQIEMNRIEQFVPIYPHDGELLIL